MIEKQFIDSLIQLFERDLNKLEEEIKLYQNENDIWKTSGDIKNPAGNLCLHLCGNLQHYIGKILGSFEYTRNRELEFSSQNVSRENLIGEIQRTRQRVITTLQKLEPSSILDLYPIAVFDYPMTSLYFLQHLHSHLNYHLGQTNYHRRLIN